MNYTISKILSTPTVRGYIFKGNLFWNSPHPFEHRVIIRRKKLGGITYTHVVSKKLNVAQVYEILFSEPKISYGRYNTNMGCTVFFTFSVGKKFHESRCFSFLNGDNLIQLWTDPEVFYHMLNFKTTVMKYDYEGYGKLEFPISRKMLFEKMYCFLRYT